MQLSFRAIAHEYVPGVPLFSPVWADIGPGSVTVLSGPSGSGKSTLLGIAAGQITPTSGTIETTPGNSFWVFQNPFGVARRTALEHVALPYLAQGDRRPRAQARAHGLLRQFGLAECADAYFHELSGGQAQRVMMARAVATGRDLLLVDEPTAQLDSRSAQEVVNVLEHLAGAGRTVLVATHDERILRSTDTIISVRPPA
ncbi:ABC transporter ATP-binding protein [Agromyces sp. NPDC058104]|uniref:ABC transporter ATP-binding protein n=1 Tax=Agromyces sp. NPDC058104 TaxID=3346342 RepID=UPI0036DE9604